MACPISVQHPIGLASLDGDIPRLQYISHYLLDVFELHGSGWFPIDGAG